MGILRAWMRCHGQCLQAMALAACAVVLASALDESAVALNGEESSGWVSDDLGESQAQGGSPSAMSSSSSFALAGSSVTMSYKLSTGAQLAESAGLSELRGKELIGEAADEDSTDSVVNLGHLQQQLESQADMMGRISRMQAVKVLMSLQPPTDNHLREEAMDLIQTSASAEWGRRRRNAAWQQKRRRRTTAKAKAKPAKKAAKGAAKKVAKPPVKVVVKKAAKKEKKKAKTDPVDEARVKANKAINMAREKQTKARKKAEKEAAEAQKEAVDKKKFELSEKRKHEITKKTEKQREKKMKIDEEKSAKKAKEAAVKAKNLEKAVKKAREATKTGKG